MIKQLRISAILILAFWQIQLIISDSLPSSLQTGLLLWMPFNGNANDESSNNNNGVVSQATLTTDRIEQPNKAYYFDGSKANIIVGDGSRLNVDTSNQLTISVWAKPDATQSYTIAGVIDKSHAECANNGKSLGWVIQTDPNSNVQMGWIGCGVESPNCGDQRMYVHLPMNPNAWNHLIVTAQIVNGQGVFNFYVNNTKTATIENHLVTKIWSNYGAPLYIGNVNCIPRYFKGKIDDIRIYSRVISDSEIQALWYESCNSTCHTCRDEYLCFTCKAGHSFLNYICQISCPFGYYSENGFCLSCKNSSCLSCNTANHELCSGCYSNYYFLAGNCYNSCPFGYQNQDQNCQACNNSCSTCFSSADNCINCTSSLAFLLGKCQSVCPDSYFIDQKNCSLCNSSCIACSISADNCLSCNNGLQFLNGKCQMQCPEQYYAISSSNCSECNATCKTCRINSSYCTSCKEYNQLLNGTCFANCPEGYVVDQNVCSPCNQTCLSCSINTNHCEKCPPQNQYFLNNTCQFEKCPEEYIKTDNKSCTMCQEKERMPSPDQLSCWLLCNGDQYYDTNSDSCKQCAARCIQCKNSTFCTKCEKQQSLIWIDKQTVTCQKTQCLPTQYRQNGECFDCRSECLACNQIDYCTKCISGQGINKSSLICERCKINQTAENGQCLTSCENGFYLHKEKGICEQCPSPCKNCYNQSFCIQCQNNQYLFSNGSCLESCPQNGFISQRKKEEDRLFCWKCDLPYCNACFSLFECKDCNNHYNECHAEPNASEKINSFSNKIVQVFFKHEASISIDSATIVLAAIINTIETSNLNETSKFLENTGISSIIVNSLNAVYPQLVDATMQELLEKKNNLIDFCKIGKQDNFAQFSHKCLEILNTSRQNNITINESRAILELMSNISSPNINNTTNQSEIFSTILSSDDRAAVNSLLDVAFNSPCVKFHNLSYSENNIGLLMKEKGLKLTLSNANSLINVTIQKKLEKNLVIAAFENDPQSADFIPKSNEMFFSRVLQIKIINFCSDPESNNYTFYKNLDNQEIQVDVTFDSEEKQLFKQEFKDKKIEYKCGFCKNSNNTWAIIGDPVILSAEDGQKKFTCMNQESDGWQSLLGIVNFSSLSQYNSTLILIACLIAGLLLTILISLIIWWRRGNRDKIKEIYPKEKKQKSQSKMKRNRKIIKRI